VEVAAPGRSLAYSRHIRGELQPSSFSFYVRGRKRPDVHVLCVLCVLVAQPCAAMADLLLYTSTSCASSRLYE
jgi:hypothetical protein